LTVPRASSPHDFTDAGGHFLTGDTVDFAGSDFLDPSGDFSLPGGLDFRLSSMQILGQSPDQFADLFRRPVAGFLNDLIQCHWHRH
jgi:hypothetical protein